MYVFDFGASISSLESWNFISKFKKTFCKMYVFDSGASISGLESWNFIPKLQKRVKCMFLTLVLQFQAWNLEISFRNWKIYILQCKMYVFDSGASISGLESWNFIPKMKKPTFYSVKCIFLTLGLQFQVWNFEISFRKWLRGFNFRFVLTLGLQFQVWNLEISFQNWRNIHFTL